ncbi:MAG: hypothetical protein EBR81_14200 [Proteobacteria bacterium]|nr:hypothetical protein [Pseudomonadota bacterium]
MLVLDWSFLRFPQFRLLKLRTNASENYAPFPQARQAEVIFFISTGRRNLNWEGTRDVQTALLGCLAM